MRSARGRTKITCAPMKRRNCRASKDSSTDLPDPVGPTTRVWPTSPTCRSSRNGVLPRVSAIIRGGASKVPVALRSRPHRRHRRHVRKVQGVDDGLAHIGVGVAGKRPEPRFHRIQGLAYRDEPTAVDDPLDGQQLLAGLAGGRTQQPSWSDSRRPRRRRRVSCSASSASAALLSASGSTSAVSRLNITSRRMAETDLRLANHWRLSRVRCLLASVLSRAIQRVVQR